MTELLPRKAKRRIWSLRRRDGPKSRKLHYGELVGRGHVSPHPKHYSGDSTGAANRGPAKAQRKWVWWGKEESPKGISSGHNETTELLPQKAKRRMWSLRRRDGPKSR